MTDEIRRGSSPEFCPPVEEGVVFAFEDQAGNPLEMEFLGLLLYPADAAPDEQARYGFFFPVGEGADGAAVGDSGEVVCLEVTELDEDGQPAAFELPEDELLLAEVYAAFEEATKDIYRFE